MNIELTRYPSEWMKRSNFVVPVCDTMIEAAPPIVADDEPIGFIGSDDLPIVKSHMELVSQMIERFGKHATSSHLRREADFLLDDYRREERVITSVAHDE